MQSIKYILVYLFSVFMWSASKCQRINGIIIWFILLMFFILLLNRPMLSMLATGLYPISSSRYPGRCKWRRLVSLQTLSNMQDDYLFKCCTTLLQDTTFDLGQKRSAWFSRTCEWRTASYIWSTASSTRKTRRPGSGPMAGRHPWIIRWRQRAKWWRQRAKWYHPACPVALDHRCS